MENNPYSTPDSEVAPELQPGELHPPRHVPAGNGVKWISEGFAHFTQDAGNWILICLVGFAITLALSFIPIVAQLAQFTAAIWTGGLMLGCHSQYQGKGLNINHLFAGFSNKPGQLLVVGVITGVLTFAAIVLVGIVLAIFYGSAFLTNAPEQLFTSQYMMPLLLGILVIVALSAPIIAMAWFAPALVVLNNVPVMEALGMSFKACFINFVPFLLYGLILLLLFIVGSLPIGLGLLVVMPLFYGSIYRSYKDIFIDTD